MKLVDANLLLYAVNADSPSHAKARAWLEEQLSGAETVAFEWTVLLAFIRLSTHGAVFSRPLTLKESLDLVDSWLDQPCAIVAGPGPRHPALMRELLSPLGSAGNLIADAHLAAVAIDCGAELCSCDADFSRFAGLRWSNPLA